MDNLRWYYTYFDKESHEKYPENPTPKDVLNAKTWNYKGEESNFNTCVRNFFNHPHIKELVKANEWYEIFKCWKEDYSHRVYSGGGYYGNYPGWILTPLTDFLYVAGINFWDYIPLNADLEAIGAYNLFELVEYDDFK